MDDNAPVFFVGCWFGEEFSQIFPNSPYLYNAKEIRTFGCQLTVQQIAYIASQHPERIVLVAEADSDLEGGCASHFESEREVGLCDPYRELSATSLRIHRALPEAEIFAGVVDYAFEWGFKPACVVVGGTTLTQYLPTNAQNEAVMTGEMIWRADASRQWPEWMEDLLRRTEFMINVSGDDIYVARIDGIVFSSTCQPFIDRMLDEVNAEGLYPGMMLRVTIFPEVDDYGMLSKHIKQLPIERVPCFFLGENENQAAELEREVMQYEMGTILIRNRVRRVRVF